MLAASSTRSKATALISTPAPKPMISPIVARSMRKSIATRAPITSEDAARVPHPKAAAISCSSPRRARVADAHQPSGVSAARAGRSIPVGRTGTASRTSRNKVTPLRRGHCGRRLAEMSFASKGTSMSFSRRGTLAVVCLATAMLMLDIAVVNTALAHIASSLDAGITGIQWVVDAYTVALAAVVLTSGSIADRLGRRRVFASGLVLFTAASLLCGAATSIEMLDAARAVQGIGGAILFATSLALLADAFPEWKERSKALAIYGATIGASFAVGPAVGGAITSYLGWRWVFYVNVPVGIAAVVATYRWVRESRDPNARRVDWAGQTALIGGLFLLVLALLRGNQDGWGSPAIVGELVGAAVLLAAFLGVESRVKEPMLPLGLFRIREFTGAQV